MDKENPILTKSYGFALDSIQLYRLLKQQKEYTLGKQLLRCGTSIGANVEEAIGGHSRSDFSWKISIAYKEAREAHYWLRLLKDSNFFEKTIADQHLRKAEELIKILSSIQKTMRKASPEL